jgi:hypothetical protein
VSPESDVTLLPEAINETYVANWQHAKSVLSDFKPSWVFRGQAHADWQLNTSLERLTLTISAENAETKMTTEFQRRAHHYPEAVPLPESVLDWLALMQHYGAPTRLLDFTRSPYVAAYFALEATDDRSSCAIWAVDEVWCRNSARRCLEQTDVEAKVLPLYCDFSNPSTFERFVMAGSCRFVVPVEPFRLHQRMTAQQGLFLCPGEVDATFMENLGALLPTGKSARVVRKIVIPGAERAAALQDLNLMNISRSTLFPGIEGLARSLSHRLTGIRDDWESIVKPQRKPVEPFPKPLSADEIHWK